MLWLHTFNDNAHVHVSYSLTPDGLARMPANSLHSCDSNGVALLLLVKDKYGR